MKIRAVRPNNHKKAFEVTTHNEQYWFPYAQLELRPSRKIQSSECTSKENSVLKGLPTSLPRASRTRCISTTFSITIAILDT